LIATLLRNQPQLAEPLLGVTIVYNNNQTLDWVDIIIAALNVLPGLAAKAAAELHSSASYTQPFAAASPGPQNPLAAATSSSGSSGSSGFAWSVLNSLADCLAAAAAAAACQPSRVLSALCSCQLFEGVVAAGEPLGLVPLEELGGWVQQQQAAGAALEDWTTLNTLQVCRRGCVVLACQGCRDRGVCCAGVSAATSLCRKWGWQNPDGGKTMTAVFVNKSWPCSVLSHVCVGLWGAALTAQFPWPHTSPAAYAPTCPTSSKQTPHSHVVNPPPPSPPPPPPPPRTPAPPPSQGLQQLLEVPAGRYPLTRAVVTLTTLLLVQQSTWGPVPSLVGFTLHR